MKLYCPNFLTDWLDLTTNYGASPTLTFMAFALLCPEGIGVNLTN